MPKLAVETECAMTNLAMEVEKAYILVVDDNPEILELVGRAFELMAPNYIVSYAYNGEQAIKEMQGWHPDLVILDLSMPGTNGYQVIQWIRSEGDDTPIIMLSAHQCLKNQLEGFRHGCDDYIAKPFKPALLHAHVEAQLRRRRNFFETKARTLRFADIEMNLSNHRVRRGAREIELTRKEYDLLKFFLQHPKTALRREHILRCVWGSDAERESNILETYIRYLRSKLETNNETRLVQTVRGVGYILEEAFVEEKGVIL
jgi:DNA-binding response OmpR family regulator